MSDERPEGVQPEPPQSVPQQGIKHDRKILTKRLGIFAVIFGLPIIGIVVFTLLYPEYVKERISITGKDLGDENPDTKDRIQQFVTEITPPISETPTPTVIPIAKGPQTYFVNSTNTGKLRIQQVEINEFDPKIGSEQTIQAIIRDMDLNPIQNANIMLTTDKGDRTIALHKEGMKDKSEIWSGSWNVDDTHDYVYYLKVSVTGATETSSVDLMFR